MKILLLSTSSSRNAGGLYNSVRNLGQELTLQKKVKPYVMAFKDENSERDNKVYEPLELIEYNIIGPSGVAFTIDLINKIKFLKPDLIHTQGIWLFSSFVNSRYCERNNIPYIISPRGMLDPWILSVRSWKKKIGLFLYENKHLKNATCIHALCIPEYKAIRKFGCKNPIAIIPNGVNIPDKNFNLNEDFYPEWKKNDNRKVLLFLSRLHPKKGLENLIEAWNLVKNKEWKLVIAGESQTPIYSNKLKQLVQSLDLESDIEFIGPQYHKDKDFAFRCSDAFILPSFSEGMPMAVLEAWSYSLPVLITDGCNLEESFGYGAAIRIEPTVASIKNELTKFFQLPTSNRVKLGNNGYSLVLERYTWASIAKQTVELYEWCKDKTKSVPNFIKLD